VPDEQVAEAMPAKLDGIGTFFHELAERVHEGVGRGWVAAEFAVAETIAQLEAALAVAPASDPMLSAVAVPDGIDADAFRARLQEAIERSVRPGMAAYRHALRDQALPVARPEERCGLSWLPDGDDAYNRTLRYYTTTAKTAQEIHEIGLAQVAKLADEYRALGPEVVGTDDLQQIFEAMRTDPKLHFEHADELVEQSRVALARAEAAMGDWFEVVPQAPCAVSGTEVGAKAFYYPPATDGSRGGTFFVNTADPETWGRFELESMAFHEGIPGHHLQLTLQKQADLPMLRKAGGFGAYIEGWALYSEQLAQEMGFYADDPAGELGYIHDALLRSGRLVTDTGIHALRWSREKAVETLSGIEGDPPAYAGQEIERYAVHPGQACSYMVGKITILRLREKAKTALGPRFDIRQFHDAVLLAGSMPLTVLESAVDNYIAARKA
jgi:uncharacterized protein (DUF885 family)